MSFRSMAWSTISKAFDRSSATRMDLWAGLVLFSPSYEGTNFAQCSCCAVACSEPMLVFMKWDMIFEERENRRLKDGSLVVVVVIAFVGAK